ncbi:MAG: hypothetical protein CVU39_11695 [Chloroflexi bacterium HGW-Chloroflexi-10]|nr:MAG: hypothetical protein CVU39_11695 [Chloroflexi bacterium HGW-Chloroflexi-10]
MGGEKRFSIRLLGTPKLFWNGKQVSIQRRMARILVYYLACQHSDVSRSELMNLLWPEELNARRNLRDLLSKLRSELPSPDLIITDRDWIRLDFDQTEVDVLVFEEAYRQLTLPFLSLENRPLPEPVFEKMISAVNMWDAPQFMNGISILDNDDLETWLSDKHQVLLDHRLDLMLRLSSHLTNTHDWDGALQWLDEIVALDDHFQYPKAVYARLDALYHLERLNQALDYARQVEEVWGPEGLANYTSQFKMLVERIQKERSSRPANRPAFSKKTAPLVPFTGQTEVMEQLRKAFFRGNMVCLTGVAGIGKSRIIQEFEQQFAKNAFFVKLCCLRVEKDILFHPLVDWMRKEVAPEQWKKMESFWVAQLQPILPELQRILPLSSMTYDSMVDNQRRSIFEAIRQLLIQIANNRKIVIVLDDAHWSDAETIAFLDYLFLRGFFEESGLLINAFREMETTAHFKEFLQVRSWQNQMIPLTVQPVRVEDVSQIALSVLRAPISSKAANQLMDATGGVPLFVIESLRAIIELSIQQVNGMWQRIPLSGVVHAVFRDQLGRLSSNARQILNSAAVIGREFTFSFLSSATGLDNLTLVSGLEELQEQGFIRLSQSPYAENQYCFCQQLLQEVASLEISETRRQMIFLHLAQMLESELEARPNDPILISRAAAYYADGGQSLKAFRYWLKAAKLKIFSGDGRTSFEAYQNAQMIVRTRGFDISHEQIYELYVGWGEQALLRYDMGTANECFNNAILEGQRRSDDLLLGSGYSGMAHLYAMRGLPVQAAQYAERAIYYLRDGPLDELIKARTRQSIFSAQQSNITQALIEIDNALQLANLAATPAECYALTNAYHQATILFILHADIPDALKFARKTADLAAESGVSELKLKAELGLAMAAFAGGQNLLAMQHCGTAMQLSEANYIWWYALQTTLLAAKISLALGRSSNCLEHIQNAMNLADLYQNQHVHGDLFNLKGKLYLSFGDYKTALACFEEGLLLSRQMQVMAINQHGLGLTRCLLGDLDGGLFQLREAIRVFELWGLRKYEWEARAHLALILYQNGQVENALNEITRVTAESVRMGTAGAGSASAYIQAMEAIKQEKPVFAREAIQNLMDMANREGGLWLRWHAVHLGVLACKNLNQPIEDCLLKQEEVLVLLGQMQSKEIVAQLDPENPPIVALT